MACIVQIEYWQTAVPDKELEVVELFTENIGFSDRRRISTIRIEYGLSI